MLKIRNVKKIAAMMVLTMLIVVSGNFVYPNFMSNKVMAAAQAEFYVSPTGSDDNPGTLAQPFATVEKARQTVRAINSNMTGDIIVYLRGGTYTLSSTINYDYLDSGTNGYKIIYKNYQSEEPVFTAGANVSGSWTVHSGSIYKTYVGTDVDFRQLYINGVRAVRARYPNQDEPEIRILGYASTNDGFDLDKGILDDISNLSKVEMAVRIAWMHKRLRISNSYDVGQYTRAVINPVEWDDINNEPQGCKDYTNQTEWPNTAYFLENAYEFLNTPGEWYLNRSDGYLYYWPRTGEDLTAAVVTYPKLDMIAGLNGTFDNPVSSLTFDGITFCYTNWTRPNEWGFVDVQANSLIPADPNDIYDPQYRHNQKKDRVTAAFHAFSSNNITITRCKFTHLGGTGIIFDNGGSDNLIKGNVLTDISGGGIEVGNDCNNPNDGRMLPRRYTVSNNYISYIGQEYYGSIPILGYYIDTYIVEHNEIRHVPYTGISCGWGWDGKLSQSKSNQIRYNYISDFMTQLVDGGGIYVVNYMQDTHIDQNYIHHIREGQVAYGIYFDRYSRYQGAYKNVIESVPGWLRGSWDSLNITADNNYTTTSGTMISGSGFTVTNTHLVSDANWPADALSVINESGLEPDWEYIRPNDTPLPTPEPTPSPLPVPEPLPFNTDGFEDGNSNNWTVEAGTWSVVTDTSRPSGEQYVLKDTDSTANAQGIVCTGDSSWTNYSYEAKVKLGSGTNQISGLVFRYTDQNNYYMLRLNKGIQKLELYKRVGGAFTLLKQVPAVVNADTWYTLKTEAVDNSITGFLNGVKLISYTNREAELTSGKIGIRSIDDTVSIDDVSYTMIYKDNFQDRNLTGWTVINGTWDVRYDRDRQRADKYVMKDTNSTPSAIGLICADNTSWSDYMYSADVKLCNGANAASGLVFRYTDPDGYYMLRLHRLRQTIQLYKRVGGEFVLLQETAADVYGDKWYTLTAGVTGNNIKGYLNGELKIDFTNPVTELTGGKIGIRSFDDICGVDNVIVRH